MSYEPSQKLCTKEELEKLAKQPNSIGALARWLLEEKFYCGQAHKDGRSLDRREATGSIPVTTTNFASPFDTVD
jgi:hypothetical protein